MGLVALVSCNLTDPSQLVDAKNEASFLGRYESSDTPSEKVARDLDSGGWVVMVKEVLVCMCLCRCRQVKMFQV